MHPKSTTRHFAGTLATWRTVKGILVNPSRRNTASNLGKHLLAGLALCGVCNDGSTMRSSVATVKGVKYPIYECRTELHLARRADYCDKLVEEMVFGMMSAPDARDLLIPEAGPDKSALRTEAMALRTRRDELKALWRAGVMTVAEVATTDAELRENLAAVEARMADPDRSRALRPLLDAETLEAVKTLWAGLDWTQKRAVVATLMTVTVLPVPKAARRRFDPNFVVIEPR